jgi:predicted O-methyltransferase YrrM
LLSCRSEDFLHDAAARGDQFDLIFNDGSHTIGDKVTNAFFADRCLAPGGIMAFHDAFHPSTVASVQYLANERGYSLVKLELDVRWKAVCRSIRYALRYGSQFDRRIPMFTCQSLIALRKEDH